MGGLGRSARRALGQGQDGTRHKGTCWGTGPWVPSGLGTPRGGCPQLLAPGGDFGAGTEQRSLERASPPGLSLGDSSTYWRFN